MCFYSSFKFIKKFIHRACTTVYGLLPCRFFRNLICFFHNQVSFHTANIAKFQKTPGVPVGFSSERGLRLELPGLKNGVAGKGLIGRCCCKCWAVVWWKSVWMILNWCGCKPPKADPCGSAWRKNAPEVDGRRFLIFLASHSRSSGSDVWGRSSQEVPLGPPSGTVPLGTPCPALHYAQNFHWLMP